jgi:hypothetical protein
MKSCLMPDLFGWNVEIFSKDLIFFLFQILSNMCKQGFDDALMFLHRNNLINCTRCLAVQSTYVISETLDESLEFDPECQECKQHRQVSGIEGLTTNTFIWGSLECVS